MWATDGEETNTTLSTPARRAVSRTTRVPVTLVSTNSSQSPAKETLAARCTTSSTPSMARATASGSVTEPRTSSTFGWSASGACRRWSSRTVQWRAASSRATCSPSIPEAPVTSTVRPSPDSSCRPRSTSWLPVPAGGAPSVTEAS